MFFKVLNRLNDIDLEFDLILAGDTQHKKPEEFERAWKRFGDQITHFGYVEDVESYSKLLHSGDIVRSEEHTSELQSRGHLVCRLLLEKKKIYYRLFSIFYI